MNFPFGDHTGPSSSTRLLIVSYGFSLKVAGPYREPFDELRVNYASGSSSS